MGLDTLYKILESEDRGEAGLVHFDAPPTSCRDSEGRPMKIVKDFRAASWEKAMQAYYDHYGWGIYVPMDP